MTLEGSRGEDMTNEKSDYRVGRIMVVDDEVELKNALCEMLGGQGYEAAGFLTGAEALEVLKEQEFDLLLTDLMMPGMDGIELIRAGLLIDPNLVGIIMTGHGTVQTAVEAMKTGAFDYLLKPFKLATLVPLLSRAMQVRTLRMENMHLKETVAIHELGKAIAFSTDSGQILNKIADAALQQCNADEVSIMLPTRDGKELYVAVVRGGNMNNLGSRAPIAEGIAGWVAQNREPIVLKGTVDDPRMAPLKPRPDIRTAVSMPMMSSGSLMGVMNVNITNSHRAFTLGQLKALGILVSIISPILEKTWLHIQVRAAEEKYRSIFENAIEGIFQRSPDGRLIAVNPSFARTFGYDSPEDLMANVTNFVQEVYIDPDRGTEFARLMEKEGRVRDFEYRARRKDGSQAWISVSGQAIRDEDAVLLHYEGMSADITERKLSESRLRLTKEILETLNRPNNIVKLIEDILHLLKEHTGIEAIGIRLREGDDYPYYVTNGFPPHFVEAENHLCTRDEGGETIRDAKGDPRLKCMCGEVLRGRPDHSRAFFTEGGSFWTNGVTDLLASIPSETHQAFTENRCIGEGYESVALIPLKSGDEVIGLLQLNDKRPDRFTKDGIHFFEGIAASIGIAIDRRLSAERIRLDEARLEGLLRISQHRDEPIRDLLDRALEEAISLTGSKIGYIYFYDDQKKEFSLNTWSRDVMKECTIAETQTIYALEKTGIWGEAVRQGKPIVLNEFHAPNPLKKGYPDGHAPLYRYLTVPVFSQGRIVAVAAVANKGSDYDHSDVRQLTLLMESVWSIIESETTRRALSESEKKLKFLSDRMNDIIWTADLNFRIDYVSPSVYKALGFSPDEYRKLTLHEMLAPESSAAALERFKQEMEQDRDPGVDPERFVKIEMASYKKDGGTIWFESDMGFIRDDEGRIAGLYGVSRNIDERRRLRESRQKVMDQLRKALGAIVQAIAMTVETRDPYTAGHQRRVADLARAVALEMDLHADQVEGLYMAAAIHDIGKISVPAEILSKPTKLLAVEFDLIKVHAQAGYNILKDIEFPWPIARIVLEHHERLDGSGYPNGIKGDMLLPESRILVVADVVESMASHRPYRASLGIDAALQEIEKNKETLYDADVVAACLRLFREKGFQFQP